MHKIGFLEHARHVAEYEPGTSLFIEGESGEAMYGVLEGEVDLIIGRRVLDTVGPGGIVGEMALVDGSPRSATAIARTPARIAQITKPEFMYLVHEHPTFALDVMGALAERLRRANSAPI